MSTTPTPSPNSFAQPATGWYPQLSGLQLPQQLTNGMTQSFSLIYSLRDSQNLMQSTLQSVIKQLIQYGSHDALLQINPNSVPDGALFFERETGDVYQARFNATATSRDWIHILAGIAEPVGP